MEETISNRRLAQAFMGALNNRNHTEFQKRLMENAVLDFPGPGQIKSRKKIISFIKALFRRFPQLECQHPPLPMEVFAKTFRFVKPLAPASLKVYEHLAIFEQCANGNILQYYDRIGTMAVIFG